MKAEKELNAATNAAVDLRALVEEYFRLLPFLRVWYWALELTLAAFLEFGACCSQVGEKEKWQRYCWELEERLHEAMHASKAKEVCSVCSYQRTNLFESKRAQ